MRTLSVSSLVLGLLLWAGGSARADDDVKAILDKAIKAHGGADKLNEDKATQSKTKGTLHLQGGISFTEESTLQNNRLKSVLTLEISGKTVTQTTVYNGEKAWVNVLGQTEELKDKALDEVKELLYMGRVTRLTTLKDKAFELSSLGEIKVNDRPAVGIKVACKGHRDINLFFDKETGLIAKLERQGVDAQTEKDFNEERIVTEYQEKEGVKETKKALVNRDGKKFLEVEVEETKTRDKLDDSEFAKP